MRSEAKFHQRLCFRQTGGRKPILDLILTHRVISGIVPSAGGFFVQEAGLDQCFLDLPDPRSCYVAGQIPVVDGIVVVHVILLCLTVFYYTVPAAVCSSVLGRKQPQARYEQQADSHCRRPSNPYLVV